MYDRSLTRFTLWIVLVLSLAAGYSPQLSAKNKLPEVSHDGLHLQKDTKLAAVYLKPGATLNEYDKVAILDCFVSFKKNWQRDYNADVMGLDRRVTDKDVTAIKKRVADEFKAVFTKELETKGGSAAQSTAAQFEINSSGPPININNNRIQCGPNFGSTNQ